MWMAPNRDLIYGARPAAMEDVEAAEEVWIRGLAKDGERYLFVDLEPADPGVAATVEITVGGRPITVSLPAGRHGPVVVR